MEFLGTTTGILRGKNRKFGSVACHCPPLPKNPAGISSKIQNLWPADQSLLLQYSSVSSQGMSRCHKTHKTLPSTGMPKNKVHWTWLKLEKWFAHPAVCQDFYRTYYVVVTLIKWVTLKSQKFPFNIGSLPMETLGKRDAAGSPPPKIEKALLLSLCAEPVCTPHPWQFISRRTRSRFTFGPG